MKAALTYGPFDTRVEDIPEPTPGPGQVMVQGPAGRDDGVEELAFQKLPDDAT